MANVAVVGTQWGDEGKGKVLTILARKQTSWSDFKAGKRRSHPGCPWGEDDLSSYPFRHPSQRQKVFIGNGVVLDPEVLLEEMED